MWKFSNKITIKNLLAIPKDFILTHLTLMFAIYIAGTSHLTCDGNSMSFFLFQILSVVRKPAMRTPRNLFIVNLAVADLLLCTVTMPLTLMEILTKYFPLGNNIFICKLIGILQATSTYVSTITITAIALDRYQVSKKIHLTLISNRIKFITENKVQYGGGKEDENCSS